MSQSIVLPKFLEVGEGALNRAGDIAIQLGCKRVMIVSDRVMASLGQVDHIREIISQAGLEADVFTDTMPEPTETSILPAVTQTIEGHYDGIIALGGGSVIDSAKAIALLAQYRGRIRDYSVPNIVTSPIMPLIAIPTTAGTGSEVTRMTIITDESNDEKLLCMGPGLIPSAAIIDFSLTMTAPARITADTGIDALTHAIEAYVSGKSGLFTDQQAILAMKLIAPNLREAVNNPENKLAKEQMMLGATLAGMAFSNASVALVHGMSRPIGAHFHVPHGMSNAMLLPTVTEYSIPAAKERYADCARAMGVADTSTSDDGAVALLLEELKQINKDLSVPSMSEFGIDKQAFWSSLEVMSEQALASGSPNNNPRVPDKETMIELYKAAW
ncbi:iron-containing alcohol dehydrogenase [Vibrio alginolyticus]|uniref:iron-containing alcohol dehydrogenase n=1 Tax=Vibrio alginolyticus TaxID=663 RepID=UPI001BD6D848|nr:iron-containing alcohol dehydrogenase [Vibrio alginolyticus]ELA9243574.1 iron-containing alcohol dehydrogenase [Vibrio alginolyticus]MBT0083989.1 iron-containing alcohol dehydrogenase [Vibrio alginolyticus]